MHKTHRTLLASLLSSSCLLAASAVAGIKEIPPEEMTEAYIRDTTVIVPRQPSTTSTGAAATVRIEPLDELPSSIPGGPGDDASARPDLTPSAEQYLSEQRDRALQQQLNPQYSQPALDPQLAAREEYLRNILGLQPGQPIDYNNLKFPVPAPIDLPAIPPGLTGFNLTADQFSISIPNNNNHPPISQQTPGGELSVNVTPTDVIFTINLPQR